MATDFLFTGNNILSFRFFWKPLLQLEGSHYLKKKKSYFCYCRENRFLQFFFQILTQMEVAFRFSEMPFLKNISFWLVAMDIRLITNFVLLFEVFICWWTQCLKLGVNQFSSIFPFLTAEVVFPASENGYFIKWFMETDFLLSLLLLRPHVMLIETIIQIKVKPFFIE